MIYLSSEALASTSEFGKWSAVTVSRWLFKVCSVFKLGPGLCLVLLMLIYEESRFADPYVAEFCSIDVFKSWTAQRLF